MPAARVIEASFYDARALDELKRKYSNLRLVNATLVFGFATLTLIEKGTYLLAILRIIVYRLSWTRSVSKCVEDERNLERE